MPKKALSKEELIKTIQEAENRAQEARLQLEALKKEELDQAHTKFEDYSSNEELIAALLENESPESRYNILAQFMNGQQEEETTVRKKKKMTAEAMTAIKLDLDSGEHSQRAIAEKHGFSLATIARVARGDYNEDGTVKK